ncbi:hypothetical protein [Mesorhizobium sp. B3-1-9]|uniref:hypothetical protein n=2 Tax=Mesorhizobium TaxID=68287 RepID=UPI0015E3DAD1|nr:hypothetical protein [Mesorhizobium sp. B3-1-9]
MQLARQAQALLFLHGNQMPRQATALSRAIVFAGVDATLHRLLFRQRREVPAPREEAQGVDAPRNIHPAYAFMPVSFFPITSTFPDTGISRKTDGTCRSARIHGRYFCVHPWSVLSVILNWPGSSTQTKENVMKKIILAAAVLSALTGSASAFSVGSGNGNGNGNVGVGNGNGNGNANTGAFNGNFNGNGNFGAGNGNGNGNANMGAFSGNYNGNLNAGAANGNGNGNGNFGLGNGNVNGNGNFGLGNGNANGNGNWGAGSGNGNGNANH